MNWGRLRKSFWRQIHNPQHETSPIFLVGCGRSGTSMLVRQLDRSWQVELYNEDNQAAFEHFRLREFSVLDRLIEGSKAPAAIFKPILSTTQTLQLLSHFPDARIVFPFRHYNDVINSSLKKFGVENRINHVRSWMEDDFSEFAVAPPPAETKELIRQLWKPSLNPETGAALFWLFYNQLFYDLKLDKNDRAFLIRYETLVADSKPQMMALVEFLGLQFEEKMAEEIFTSSVGRDDPPEIDEEIQAACDRLYRRLSEDVSIRK
ncbi:MAG: sulfotransferase [Chloroflexi bacterium]|nr:sulfotransferase [Chloroflexota bacterium]